MFSPHAPSLGDLLQGIGVVSSLSALIKAVLKHAGLIVDAWWKFKRKIKRPSPKRRLRPRKLSGAAG
jgi:hypothetical protein